MSRVGKRPIEIPNGIKVSIEAGTFTAEGPKGTVSERLLDGIPVAIDDGIITVSRDNDSGDLRSKHGLVRALLANAVNGVSVGFLKELELHGVGFKAEVQGRAVHFALGFSHPIVYEMPEGVDIEVDKNNKISVKGADRQAVGQVAAEIRALKKPDPYKGKGIKYVDEVIRRKVGKAGAGSGA